MKIFQNILASLAVLVCFSASAQLSDKIIERDGIKYQVYTVEKGKTFYRLQKEFGVSKNELIKHNPSLENGLKVGDTILIPAKEEVVKPNIEDEWKGIHVVKKGETVFGICRTYKIKQKELLANNPEAESGLKIGQKLKVPGSGENVVTIEPVVEDTTDVEGPVHVLVKDSIVKHVVQPNETLYSLSKRYMVTSANIKEMNNGLRSGLKSGDTIRIKVRAESTIVLDKTPELDSLVDVNDSLVYKDVYNVVLFAPIQLDRNAIKESKRRSTEERELYGPTKVGVDFYAGMLLAIDSLKQAGVSVNVKVFDTAKDSGVVRKILEKPELAEADLIIGPFYSFNVNLVAEFAKEHKIHLAIPVSQGNKVLYKNPYVSKVVTSTTTKIKGMADYIVKNYPDANIILVDSKKDKDKYMFGVMKKQLTKGLTEHFGKPMEPKLSSVNSYSAGDIHGKISKSQVNVVVACSKDQGFATNFMTKVNGIKNSWDKYSADIKVFVLDDWEYFNSIDDLYKTKLNYHYVSNYHIPYDSTHTRKFLKSFRTMHGYDPENMGFMGFDLAYNYIGALYAYGSGFSERVALLKSQGVHTKFDIEQVQEGSGFENQSVYIIRYDGYHLVQEK